MRKIILFFFMISIVLSLVSCGGGSHPFAAALSEYIAGHDGVVLAYLVTLDDDGTMGVLAKSPTSGTLFYMQDGELFQIEVWSQLFVAGKYNRLFERLYGHTHMVEIIYKLESGSLEVSTRLEYFSDEYLLYLYGGDYDAAAERIAERDALADFIRISQVAL